MALKRRDVEAALEKKGVRRKEKGNHNFFIYFTEEEGKKTKVFTKTSHGAKHRDIGSALLSTMARQCKLAKQEFEDLVKCPLSRDQYERQLEEQGAI